MKKILAAFAAIVGLVFIARAVEVQPLDTLTKADGYGNLVVSVKYTDLTSTNSTNQTVSAYVFPTNAAVECVGIGLAVPFGGTTNNDLTVTVGDSGNVATFAASTQIHKGGTPVYWKYGIAASQIVYTAGTTLGLTFTGNSNDVKFASAYTQGEVRAYFKVKNPKKLP